MSQDLKPCSKCKGEGFIECKPARYRVICTFCGHATERYWYSWLGDAEKPEQQKQKAIKEWNEGRA